ncbi:hypothetical protein Tco_1001139 [Tanacetum coccineum]
MSLKKVMFTKADESPLETNPEITSYSESECENQEPLPPLPKLSRDKPIGTSTDVVDKGSSVKVTKKKAQTKSPLVLDPSFAKKADLSTEQLLLTLMEECSICQSTDHLTKENPEQVVVKKTLAKLKAQSSLASSTRKAPKIPKLFIPCKYYEFNDHHSDECPKVIFGDNSSGDTEGYGSVNCNGITFTRVAYVISLKHNLINISQLCDANFKVLFTKTHGTIFNQNNKVMLIAPRRRDVYVIDMLSYIEESNVCFFAKASNIVS